MGAAADTMATLHLLALLPISPVVPKEAKVIGLGATLLVLSAIVSVMWDYKVFQWIWEFIKS